MDDIPPLPPGWVELSGTDGLFLAEKVFEGDPRPMRQTSTTRRGLITAIQRYEDHRDRSKEDENLSIIDGVQHS